jgi:hypothetical protein
MCDFSLQHAKSRPAVVADKLVSHNFGRGTIGFKSVDDPIGDATAVCILPGTELAFDEPIKLRWSSDEGKSHRGPVYDRYLQAKGQGQAVCPS